MFDGLVGVNDYVLLWPVSTERFGLPFGLLPSAPKPSLTNPYFYRNLALELGIFVPLVILSPRRRLASDGD